MSNAVGSYNPPDRMRAASCRPLQARRAIQEGAEHEKFVAARYDGPSGIAAVRYPF
ncbi:hypothetical protein [Burkholderia ambifaria]|uniref:hypothetical protein n=1 Tax=Burkholderia ambifaria TaxID=152480 RepID=UPI000A9E3302|nr:hypothetical protein [Burkholderia ambifaria]